ncbi:phosphomannomutase, partial [Escherichia coli]|nr:phosphomannomutase [Escherichia coli]
MLNVKKIINDSKIAFGTSCARGLVIDLSQYVFASFTHSVLSVIDDKYNFNKVAL